MLKNLNIVTKILGGFALAMIFFVFIGVMGLKSVSNVSDAFNEVSFMNDVKIELLSREVDHLKFVNKTAEGLRDTSATTLQVKKDPRKCNLGKFLYGDKRKNIEGLVPDISSVFLELEQPHEQLHYSVVEMEKMMQNPDISREEVWATYNSVTIPTLHQVEEKLKKVISLIEVKQKSATQGLMDTKSNMSIIVIITILLGLVIAGIVAFVIRKTIKNPIEKLLTLIGSIENGDLTQRVEDYSEDEMGQVIYAINNMSEKLDKSIQTVAENATRLKNSASELNTVSGSLSESARDMNERANNVASATEEMSVTMITVSSSSEQATVNIDTVAQNTEEMTSTVNEIAQNSEKARQVTQEAVMNVQSASNKVNELGVAANDISKVIDVILDIAEQTKLLALNATIEAARAGEAGKGFAVVANEVKELAGQTNSATEEIRKSVNAMQNSTDSTVEEITKINTVMAQVDEIVSTIATAVEEQNVTTRDISTNIGQAAQGIKDMAQNVMQTAEVSKTVAADIASVSSSSESVYSESSLVDAHTSDLVEINNVLDEVVQQFKISKDDTKLAKKLDFMPWGPKLQLGISEIDMQHKRLVEMINDLHRAMKDREGVEALSRIMKGLLEYTGEHFTFEEGLQKQASYPDLDKHIDVHKNLVAQVQDYYQKVSAGDMLVSKDLMAFLKDWLTNHILVTDKKYVPYMKEAGIK